MAEILTTDEPVLAGVEMPLDVSVKRRVAFVPEAQHHGFRKALGRGDRRRSLGVEDDEIRGPLGGGVGPARRCNLDLRKLLLIAEGIGDASGERRIFGDEEDVELVQATCLVGGGIVTISHRRGRRYWSSVETLS